ncbi:MAG TPA: serine/threonine-protein kinase [Polyangiaceae bacterium]
MAVGGMSEVYLARPATGISPAPELVIKRLLPGALGDPRSVQTFRIEASLHAAARHPNVVQVFEAGEVHGEPYLAMEYVAGVDAFRLMRRTQSDSRPISAALAVFIARELAKALGCVHRLTDPLGSPLGIVHRDVTPSNIYLSDGGSVKLGDFGIARSIAEKPRASGNDVLKGKYAYLAPEQVSGEHFDHRADLFSLAVVLSEMLISQPLFPGAGQLAVLLAIRDCRIDPLRASRHLLPRGLFLILEKALAKAPDDRFASAEEFYDALAPFEPPDRATLVLQLAELVRWAADSAMLAKRIEGALRESGKMRVGTPLPQRADKQTLPPPHPNDANVRSRDGRTFSGMSFAKLVESIVTGELHGDDEVAMGGEDFQSIASIDVLARHLPPSTATTNRVDGPGIPDYAAELGVTSMLEVLAWLLVRRETGLLFADRPLRADAGELEGGASAARTSMMLTTRRELYFEKGRLTLAASSEPSELLGEYLVEKGAIDRAQLDAALSEMPRFDGHLGDTLIGLGLVDPVEVFQAIRSQGSARVARTFRWTTGRVSFYRGVKPQRIDFRLDLEIPDLMLAGLNESVSDDIIVAKYREKMDSVFVPIRPPRPHALSVAWPPAVVLMIGSLGSGRKLSELSATLKGSRNMDLPDVLRLVELTLAGGLVEDTGPRRRP